MSTEEDIQQTAEPTIVGSQQPTPVNQQTIVGPDMALDTTQQYVTADSFASFQRGLKEHLDTFMFGVLEKLTKLSDGERPTTVGPPAHMGPQPTIVDDAEGKSNESNEVSEEPPMARTSLGNTPRLQRRMSGMFVDENDILQKDPDFLLDSNINLLRRDRDVPESEKITVATLRSSRLVSARQRDWQNCYRENKPLAQFMAKSLLERLWSDQQATKATGHRMLTKDNIWRQPDEDMRKYFADSIRYVIKGRREEAIKAIIKSTDMIKARNPSCVRT